MITAASDTLAALLAAVRAEPEDDTVRLVLADCLENPDEGNDPAWGELIRVQVELARGHPAHHTAETGCPLRKRESALLAEHEARWRRGGKCKECGGDGKMIRDHEFWGTLPCPTCRGTGWTRWWLAERRLDYHLSKGTKVEWRHRVHFERGLITQVDANLADIFDGERATEWALACVRGEPGLRRFGVVDRMPYDFDVDDGMRYGWHPADNYQVHEPDHIPRELFNAIFKRVKEWEEATYFDSPAAANRALATAAWQCVRDQA